MIGIFRFEWDDGIICITTPRPIIEIIRINGVLGFRVMCTFPNGYIIFKEDSEQFALDLKDKLKNSWHPDPIKESV